MIIAIDFDGTICNEAFPYIGDIYPHAKRVIRRWDAHKNKIIIWTCRTENTIEGLPHDACYRASDCAIFLKKNGIPYEAFNANANKLLYSPMPKIFAHIYIDDRGVLGLPRISKEDPRVDWLALDMIVSKHPKYGLDDYTEIDVSPIYER